MNLSLRNDKFPLTGFWFCGLGVDDERRTLSFRNDKVPVPGARGGVSEVVGWAGLCCFGTTKSRCSWLQSEVSGVAGWSGLSG
jgi:hypothetical protein